MSTKHNLKDRGAAFSLPNLTRVEEGTGGSGAALCTCGWTSEILGSGRARKAAHADHKAEVEAYGDLAGLLDESTPSDEPVFEIVEDEADLPVETSPELADPSVVEASIEWRGNYSIVFAPATVKMTAKVSSKLIVQTTVVSAVRRISKVIGPEKDVTKLLNILSGMEIDALAELKAWQANTVEARKGQTDMQKFLANREQLWLTVNRKLRALA